MDIPSLNILFNSFAKVCVFTNFLPYRFVRTRTEVRGKFISASPTTKILKQVQDDDSANCFLYFANATERVSLITVTLICPG
ncbi:hypothetical protein BCL90_0587 [Pedobacter alluvionis]|uniref:Uncharacterized protein n=1 Tax=Pedobacter alluvionis TaxID=475253 RepID=A0A497YAJ9_9SPHI|nr:hypothetical protein BCL90_0587 [Pedobacter alluvionis]